MLSVLGKQWKKVYVLRRLAQTADVGVNTLC